MEVRESRLALDKLKMHQPARRIVDEHEQRALWAAVLKPPVLEAVDLHQLADTLATLRPAGAAATLQPEAQGNQVNSPESTVRYLGDAPHPVRQTEITRSRPGTKRSTPASAAEYTGPPAGGSPPTRYRGGVISTHRPMGTPRARWCAPARSPPWFYGRACKTMLIPVLGEPASRFSARSMFWKPAAVNEAPGRHPRTNSAAVPLFGLLIPLIGRQIFAVQRRSGISVELK
jgi:hypothetical protein